MQFNYSKYTYLNTFFQLKCCGVENYEDFTKAQEFQKYIREPGHPNKNQIIPEACCKLKDDKEMKYFEPKDPNCIEVPTVTNSYYTNVSCDTLEISSFNDTQWARKQKKARPKKLVK